MASLPGRPFKEGYAILEARNSEPFETWSGH
jgi:hypothetical protein